MPRLQLVMVDTVNDGQIDTLARRGDQHLLCARVDMLLRARAIGEEAGAFQDELDPKVAVREVCGIALGGDADALAVDHQILPFGGHRTGIFAMHAVSAEQPCVRLGVGEVVDRHQLELTRALLKDRPRDESPNAPEPVDRNLDRHLSILPQAIEKWQ